MSAGQKRWTLWLGALGLVAWLAMGGETPQEAEVIEAATPKDTRRVPAAPVAAGDDSLQWQHLAARTLAVETAADLFMPQRPTLPPPVARAPLATTASTPPKPTSPPVPFRYIGRLDVGEQEALIMLSDGPRVHTLKVGQSVNAVWRLDRDEPGALRFTYLPLNVPQVVVKSAPATVHPEKLQGVSG